MPNPVLPSGFAPQIQGYGIGAPGGVVATQVAGGSPRFALDFDRGPQAFQVTLILDAAEFTLWTVWFFHIIKKGAITFDMPLDSGFGVQTHACNIVPGSYSAVRISGPLTSVSFVVSAESRVYDLTPADVKSYLDLWELYGPDYDDFLDRLAVYANSDLNVVGL